MPGRISRQGRGLGRLAGAHRAAQGLDLVGVLRPPQRADQRADVDDLEARPRARRPSTTPDGTHASSTPIRRPGDPRQAVEGRLRRAGPGGTGPSGCRRTRSARPARRRCAARGTGPSMSSATSVARPGSQQQQGPRLDRPEHERRRRVAGEVGQVRRVAHDQDVALRRQGPPEPLATRGASLGGQHRSDSADRVSSFQLFTLEALSDWIDRSTDAQRWTGPSRPWPGPRPPSSLAMVTSPGKVVSRAPWAQPRRRASSGDRPAIRP